MTYDTVLCGAILLSAANDFVPFIGSVGIYRGQIVDVKEGSLPPSTCREWIDASEHILMPGLFNLHCHGDMTCARGFGDGRTLLEQNEQFKDTVWFRSLLSDEERADSRLLTYAEALLAGTTFQMENMYWGLGARSPELMREAGIRGAAAEDIRPDFLEPDVFHSEEELRAFAAACEANGILPYIGSISEEDYAVERNEKIREILQRLQLRQTFHMAETDWRKEHIQKQYGTTPVRWLYEGGFLGDTVLGSHVVQLDDEEVRMLAETGTSVVNTPLCEMKIADGIAPIAKMVHAGVNVCLGSDGAMWNNSSDIFREMKGMALLQTVTNGIRSLTTKDVLRMATCNGAKAVGQEQVLGSIEEGKRADLILIRTDRPHMRPLCLGEGENVTSAVVFNATGADVSDVFVEGKHVVKDHRLQTLDLPALYERVQKTAEKIRLHEATKA